jgi:hypothetical protein
MGHPITSGTRESSDVALVPIAEEVCKSPGLVWTGMDKKNRFSLTGVRTPYRPGSSESLERQKYPDPPKFQICYLHEFKASEVLCPSAET